MTSHEGSRSLTEHTHIDTGPGESAPFHFESTWQVPGNPATVWNVLSDMERWPHWWPGMSSARLLRDGDAQGQGKTVEFSVSSPLGYSLGFTVAVTSVAAPREATLTVDGDLRGVGLWSARPVGDGTVASIVWCVTSRRRSVRLFRGLAPWAHGWVMRAGERGLTHRVAGVS